MIESLDDLVFELDRAGVILDGWAADETRFFMPREAFQGKNIDSIFPYELATRFRQAIETTFETHHAQEVTYSSPFDNKTFSARFHQRKHTTDHIVVVIRDITELTQVQTQLQLSERRFRNLVKYSTDITTIIKPDGTITYQSDSYLQQFGYKSSQIGRNIFEFIHPEDQEMVAHEIRDGIERGGVSDFIEFRYRHADGHFVYIESKGNNLLHEPGIEGIVVNSRDITERKIAEQSLKKSEERYRKLLHNSLDVITVLDNEGRVVFDSFSIYTQFGYEKNLEGKSIFDFIHPEDVAKAKEIFSKGLVTPGSTPPVEFRFMASDGSWRYVEAIGNNLFHEPSINGFVVNSRDITEAKRIQSALSMSNARNSAIVESTRDEIFAVDHKLKYVSFNSAHKNFMEDHYGMRIEVGMNSVLSNEADENDLGAALEKCLQGDQFSKLYQFKPVEGEDGPLFKEVNFNPVRDESGKVIGAAVFSRDVSETKRSADELIEAKNQALAAATAKSEFLSNMSHEIRTPMNAIIGMTDLLLEKVTSPETKEYLQSIKYSSDNLLVVINDILDFSKIEAGKVSLEHIDFSLRHKLNEVKKAFDIKAKEKGLSFEVEVADDVPDMINGDPYRLNQILFNLLGNSMKFTNSGLVSVHVTRDANADPAWNKLTFEVRDTGIGIPQHKLESIFESFSQAYTDTTRKYGGTGLGLAITRRLTHLQGGKITVQSQVNQGTSFFVEIPFRKASSAADSSATHTSDGVARNLSGVQVLVAEDNVMNQFVVKQILSKWNCDITIANNGEEALTLLHNNDFDIVLMDLQMPQMSGYEATRVIRSKNTIVRKPHIPIIALTADAFPETKRKVLETGMNDFVTKPFDRDELFNKMARLLPTTTH